MFTQEELQNIFNLISIAPIKGSDALPVAQLQIKIQNLLKPEEKKEEPKEEKKK